MKTTPSTMSPLEAYEALMLFARRRGEGALRLAMHAAVPQSFRPDLLHLLKLNFLPRELHDPAAEADVLFSPLCEEVGRGYFEFGPHVRSLLLDNLAANYATDRTPRIARVANFLLFYVEHAERRNAGSLDRLRRDYLEVQRWVALAFLDPDEAARQLAEALKGTSTPDGEFAARLRLGGLASALSSPLVKYRHVLNYAAGLQALEAGDHARAQTLLSGLGNEELNVGGVRLRPASDLLRDYAPQRPEPPPTPTPEPQSTGPDPAVPTLFVICAIFPGGERPFLHVSSKLTEHRIHPHVLPVSSPDALTKYAAITKQADAVLILGTEAGPVPAYFDMLVKDTIGLSKPIFFMDMSGRRLVDWASRVGVTVIHLKRPVEEEPLTELLAEFDRIRAEKVAREKAGAEEESDGRPLRELIDVLFGPGGTEEKVSAIKALEGWSDDISTFEALTEAIWNDKDSRVRRAAVDALGKSNKWPALEVLLVAAGDEDAEVRRTAAEALRHAVESNAVLIFDFFGTDRVESREVLREELRRRGYVPLVFPLTRPPVRDAAAIVRAAAPFTRFAVADLTAPPEIQEDLGGLLEQFLSQTDVPLLPISQGVLLSKLPIELRRKYPSTVLPYHSYAGPGELREAFDRIVTEPVEVKLSGTLRQGESDEDPSEVEPEAPLSPFAYDIFISYSHLDNHPFAEGEKGWVDTLHERLHIRLEQLTGEPVKIWSDRELKGNARLTDIHAAALSQVALFVAVLTPQYVRSEWCLNELRAFMGSATTQGSRPRRGRSRVFKVVKTPVPADQEPEGLREFIGYQFFEYDETRGRLRELSPELRPNRDVRYWEKLDDLAYDIREALGELKQQAGRGDSSEAL